ncbi:MAG: prolipoprotein diacylglyceryl transferase [Buchnera aphidicola (Periphyllus lyropictus)]|uniref:prolipoprotein diacylglyceryl transferase n=1 Tax=Buchnera aphidicola TaxID=9 RepID=UPI001EC61C26|nr:prolipoprotein diacylglyceryl transferase [Buchnera aphidicola]NIH16541.1 prolipoprotein diacylglyceryl transferase [Buchnera aphidicola (Periphyllus lyropictus)]USS94434.1 prolipoprotein diacylglyceryl transferase [Buchnera aphidicola (Periphyllus lyropictus)]
MKNTYILFPNINPNFISIGFISIKWYGLAYFITLIFSLWYGKKINKKNKFVNKKYFYNLIYSCFIGLILGGRIGYILFYKFFYFLKDKFYLFKIWNGGMSFHGGLIGIILTCFIFSKKNKQSFLKITDFISLLSPFGLGIGRLGNFINSELWGRIKINSSYSFLFPNSLQYDLREIENNPKLKLIIEKYGVLPRYPSQLYEFFFEGLILFILLLIIYKKQKNFGITSSAFLIFYGIFRIFLEFFREPDIDIGFFYKNYTAGQILSIPMIVFGFILLIILLNSKKFKKL